jgi:flagellar hook-basal body complex protein FliE
MDHSIPTIRPADLQQIAPTSAAPAASPTQFLDTLQGAIGEVERLQTDAQGQVAELLTGEGADLHKTMISVEKADLAFQLMMQVRNKIVQAYQEISRMPF